MKNILTLLLLSGVIYLSSCGNGANDKIVVVPANVDSVSKGSKILLHFEYLEDTNVIRDFKIYDLARNNKPVYSLYASSVYNATDSLYHGKISLIDQQSQQVAINVDMLGANMEGTYTVVANTSSLTDFSTGQNIAYGIAVGSTVDVSKATYPMEGTMNLILNYNHRAIPCTGSFKIYYMGN